jgi:5'-methylthioinosine phosphorylase
MSPGIAVIVGSGFDDFAADAPRKAAATRFGDPSAPLRVADFEGQSVLVLPRHGDAHTLPPHRINYRANLLALAENGARAVIAANTVGVITDRCVPGGLAVPAQIIDYTWGREHTLYSGDAGSVEHVDFSAPFTGSLRDALLASADAAGIDCYDGGVYAAMQGPRLETAAEIDRLERDGADFVGMTGMPEAVLARELGLEYAMLSLVVNRAAGRGDRPIHADVRSNTAAARRDSILLLQHFFREHR